MVTEAETEVVREFYAAINRNDIPAALKSFDPEIGCIQFEGSPSGVTLYGLAEVKPYFSRARETWAEGACNPERFIAAGDKIVVLAYVRVRLKEKQEWLEGRVADVFTFRDGKVIEMRTFADKQQALDWAGAKESLAK